MEYSSASTRKVMGYWWKVFIFLLMVFGHIHSFQAWQRGFCDKENRAIHPMLTNSIGTLLILHSWLYLLTLICNVNITGVAPIVADKRLLSDSAIPEITNGFRVSCRLRESANEFYNKPLILSVWVFVLRSLHEFPSRVAPLWKKFLTQRRRLCCHGVNEPVGIEKRCKF